MATPDKGGYDPAAGLRGDVTEKRFTEDSGVESDSCGMSERGHHNMLRVFSRQGEHGISYSLLGYSPNKAGFTIRFAGCLEIDGEEREGLWKVIITGKRLDNVLRHIGLGCRTILRESGAVDDPKKPEITKIEIEAWDYPP